MNGIGRRRPTRELETNAYLRVKVRKGWSERHACGPSRGYITSMQTEESRQVTDDGGQDKPTKTQARTETVEGPNVDGSGPERDIRRENWLSSPRRTGFQPVARISHTLLLSFAHYGGCVGLVGADVVKISNYEWKTGKRERVGDVQRVHMYVGNLYRKVKGNIYPTL